MTHLAPWLSPAIMRLLALALLHFLWQGAALAALGYVAMALCRTASTRYAIGASVLALMLIAPVCTFFVLQVQEQSSPTIAAGSAPIFLSIVKLPPQIFPDSPLASYSPGYALWLVEAWFLGVLLLSLRSLGGFLLIERLRRKERTPVNQELLHACLALQHRMSLSRIVRYCESIHLDAPAVAGWIRPVVLLPLRALSGLSQSEIEAVIAHELAHIRRFDAFVNLFQVAVETLLFYHPAVWWIGKQVRAEREHCCDDIAVAVCGNPVTYAHALAHMAEGRQAPEFAMAANRSPLVARAARLLGAKQATHSLHDASVSASVIFLTVALLAGSAFLGTVHKTHAQTPAPAHLPKPATTPAPAISPEPPREAFTVRAQAEPEVAPAPEAPPAPEQPEAAPQAQHSEASTPKQSYIDSLKDAGLTDLSVDELIALKVQGVTGEYVKAMKSLGLKISPEELIGMKVQGITPDYVKQMRDATGQNLGAEDLIGLKVQGVTGDYLKQMRDLGFATDAGEIIGMKVQGVTAEYVRALRALGLKADAGEIIGLKVQGVTAEYVKGIQELGLHPDTGEIIGMRVQGITPEYLKALQGAGFKLDAGEAIGAKVQGITPEFIEKARSHGFKNLTLDKLIALKHTGIFEDEK